MKNNYLKSLYFCKLEKAHEIFVDVTRGLTVEFDGLIFKRDGNDIICTDEHNNLILKTADQEDIAGLLHNDNFEDM